MLFSHVQHYSQMGVVILTPSQAAIWQQCSTGGMLFPHVQHYSQMGVFILRLNNLKLAKAVSML